MLIVPDNSSGRDEDEIPSEIEDKYKTNCESGSMFQCIAEIVASRSSPLNRDI